MFEIDVLMCENNCTLVQNYIGSFVKTFLFNKLKAIIYGNISLDYLIIF